MLMVVAGSISGAPGDDEIDAFVREIIKNARTDSERSTLLMGAVSEAEGNKKLKDALLEKSVQYGLKGLKTVEDCDKFQITLADLLKADPDRKSHWLSQQAALFKRWLLLAESPIHKKKLAEAAVEALIAAGSASGAKGDWKKASGFFNEGKVVVVSNKLPNPGRLTGYIRAASYLSRTQDKIASHIATLKKSPDDFSTRSDLIKLLVTVMDDPVEAMKYVNEDVDGKYRTFIPMAARDISKLPADACNNLGEWYLKDLSKGEAGVVKSRMLARAKAYYERVLKLKTGADTKSATLKLSISRIELEQAKLGAADPLVCMYCSASGQMPCSACLTDDKSTGLRRCIFCRGSGRQKCGTCSGLWNLRCSRCSGKGKVPDGTEKRGGLLYKKYAKCPTCRGKRVTHRSTSVRSARAGACPTCSKLKPENFRGTRPCSECDGKGGSGTCPNCTGSKGVPCTHCAPDYVISPSLADSSSETKRPIPPKRSKPPSPKKPSPKKPNSKKSGVKKF